MTAEPATRTKTSYVVLRENGGAPSTVSNPLGGATYEVVKTIDATNATDAIKQAAGNKEGTYIAVPARSFAPVKVTVTQQTIVKLAWRMSTARVFYLAAWLGLLGSLALTALSIWTRRPVTEAASEVVAGAVFAVWVVIWRNERPR